LAQDPDAFAARRMVGTPAAAHTIFKAGQRRSRRVGVTAILRRCVHAARTGGPALTVAA
jgi:hypothetical protein